MTTLPIADLLNLTGKTAIVTGGAKGIGFGIATRFAEAGANVVIADIDEEAAQNAAAEINKKGFIATPYPADVSKKESIEKLISTILPLYNRIDILVNNAGIYPNKKIMEMEIEDFDRVIAINLRGIFLTTKMVAAQMIKQGGGKIINITSIDAIHPSAIGLAHYDASKHGVWGFTKNVALELAPYNIWVNAIAPGGIATPGVQQSQEGSRLPTGTDPSKLLENFLAKIPMKRMGDSDEIGKVALFLASDMASYITGSQIVVDGGVLLS